MCDQNSLFFTVSIPKNNGFVTTEHVAKFGDNVYTKTKNTVYSEVWTIIGKWHVLDSISARFKSVLQPVC